ncbi:MAG TPA: hypothetical protein VG276_03870 [Actinomycetes bacterium]|jgi:hypothetical protein|nr:hypothetical protein [Actinomycetes bacterium]
MKTGHLDELLSRFTAEQCNAAVDELERYLDAGLASTRELLAAFLNDLHDECLVRWGPLGDTGQAVGLPGPP